MQTLCRCCTPRSVHMPAPVPARTGRTMQKSLHTVFCAHPVITYAVSLAALSCAMLLAVTAIAAAALPLLALAELF